jgi:hypothetical protein
MVTRQEILELAQAHASLDEPSATVIWIRRNEREAWLVEVIPTMSYDEHPERPVAFNPGRTFRHPLNLIAGNLADIERALKDEHLAAAVAEGEVLIGDALGRTLVDMAKDRVESRGRSQAG